MPWSDWCSEPLPKDERLRSSPYELARIIVDSYEWVQFRRERHIRTRQEATRALAVFNRECTPEALTQLEQAEAAQRTAHRALA